MDVDESAACSGILISIYSAATYRFRSSCAALSITGGRHRVSAGVSCNGTTTVDTGVMLFDQPAGQFADWAAQTFNPDAGSQS